VVIIYKFHDIFKESSFIFGAKIPMPSVSSKVGSTILQQQFRPPVLLTVDFFFYSSLIIRNNQTEENEQGTTCGTDRRV
jgi:hypothetical protein